MKSNPFDILKDLCKVRDVTIAINKTNVISNRMKFIMDTLTDMGIVSVLYPFQSRQCNFGNIVASVKPIEADKNTLILISHHDIANPRSQSANDNSASVCHLISLLAWLKDIETNVNVVVVFTDNEECGGSGAGYLSAQINSGFFGDKVIGVINLELTGVGTAMWKENNSTTLLKSLENSLEKGIPLVRTPFNDSVVLRREKISSVCIGIVKQEEMKEMIESGKHYCHTWSMCHSEHDTIETMNESDMVAFQDNLREIVLCSL